MFVKQRISDHTSLDKLAETVFGPERNLRWAASSLRDAPRLLFVSLFEDNNIIATIQFSLSNQRVVRIQVPPSRPNCEVAVRAVALLTLSKQDVCDALRNTPFVLALVGDE